MDNKSPLGFLNTDKQIRLPEGGDFSPSGFIGKVFAQHAYTFMSQEDSANHSLPPYLGRRKQGEWFVYYVRTQSEAKVYMEVLGVQGFEGKDPNATEVWSIMVDRDTVLNFADPEKLAKWGNPIVGDVRVTTLGSKKYRHELHMLALPLAVQAMAKLLGYQYEPFSISELTRRPEDMTYSDQFFAEMFGSPDAKIAPDKTVPNDYYTRSEMWNRRAALWLSLGESDATKYQPIDGGKFATTSEKLSNCLQIVTAQWNESIYGRVVNIADPRVDATYESKTSGETKRNLIPVIYELFPDEAAAKSAAKEELARIAAGKAGKEQPSASANGSSAGVPAIWVQKDIADAWPETVLEIRKDYPTLPNVPVLKKLARQYDATEAELKTLVWG